MEIQNLLHPTFVYDKMFAVKERTRRVVQLAAVESNEMKLIHLSYFASISSLLSIFSKAPV